MIGFFCACLISIVAVRSAVGAAASEVPPESTGTVSTAIVAAHAPAAAAAAAPAAGYAIIHVSSC